MSNDDAFDQEPVPSWQEVIEQGDKVCLPVDDRYIAVLLTELASKAAPENIDKLLVCIERFPLDRQIVFWKLALKHDRSLITSDALDVWLKEHADECLEMPDDVWK